MTVDALIGALIGVVATIGVSSYFYRRSTKKELSAFELVNSRLFHGIDPTVRETLRFTYKDTEVEELSILSVLIANTGERAISGFISPPTIRLPDHIRVMDVSVEYRHPSTMVIKAHVDESDGSSVIRVSTPLLNKRDFVVVKLLLDGAIEPWSLKLEVTAEDLPRSISFGFLPFDATQKSRARFDIGALGFGAAISMLGGLGGYASWLLHEAQPSLFVWPWASFEFTWASIPLHLHLLLTGIAVLLGVLLAIFLGVGSAFQRNVHFPLPDGVGRGNQFFFSEHSEIADMEARIAHLHREKDMVRDDDA